MGDLDLKLTVSLDKDSIVNSYIKGLKEAQREAEKQTVTYTLKPDKTNFLNEVKHLLTSTPELDKEIKLVLDDSSFKKGLDDLDKYAGKKATSISTAFKKEFLNISKIRSDKNLQKEFEKSPLNLDNLIVGNKSQNKVKEKVGSIINELSKFSNVNKNGMIKELDLSKVTNYKDLERVVELTKQLDAILKQTDDKGYKVDFGNRKGLEDSVKNLQSGYAKAITQYRNEYKTQLESIKSDTEDAFVKLQSMMSNVFMGFIEQFQKAGQEMVNNMVQTGDAMGEALSNGIDDGVEKSKKRLKDLESELNNAKKAVDDIGKGIDKSELYQKLDKYKNSINKAMLKGDKVEESDALGYIESIKTLASKTYDPKSDKKFQEELELYKYSEAALRETVGDKYIPVDKLKNQKQLLDEASKEQQRIVYEIEKEKKAIEAANQEREKANNLDKANEEKEEKKDIPKEQKPVEKQEIEKSSPEKSGNAEGTEITINEQEALDSIQKVKDALGELPEKKEIEIHIKESESNNLQNMDFLKSEEKSDYTIEVKPKLPEDIGTEIQNQINNLEPKPVVKIEADFKLPEDSVDSLKKQVKDVVSTLYNVDKSSLKESTDYVEKLGSKFRQLVDFSKAYKELEYWNAQTPFSKNDLEWMDEVKSTITTIINEYPELENISKLFTSTKEADAFVGSDGWNNFLASLPKTHKYLESIGYDLSKTNKIDLTTNNEKKVIEDLRQSVTDVKKAVEEKTQAFQEEGKQVESVVGNEKQNLSELKGEIKDIAEYISNSEKTQIAFSPKLSDDFDIVLEDLIKDKTSEVLITTPVTNLAKQDKRYDEEIKRVIGSYLDDKGIRDVVSNDTKGYLKDKLKEQVASKNINAEELYNILKEDTNYVTAKYGGQYKNALNYLRNSGKIRLREEDIAEFGDDINEVRQVLKRILSPTKGRSADIVYKELSGLFPEEFPNSEDVLTTQEAIQRIFEYIRDTPQKYAELIDKELGSQKEQLINEESRKLSERTKDIKVPASYSRDAQNKTLVEENKINSQRNEELRAENELLKNEVELLKIRAQEVNANAEAQKELNALDTQKSSSSQKFDNEKSAKQETSTKIKDENLQYYDQEKGKVDEIVEAEKGKFGELSEYIKTEIPKAISEKNSAFDAEKEKVDQVVEAEKAKLGELSSYLSTNISDAIKNGENSDINQATSESTKLTSEEAAAMSELFDKAIKAAEAKKEFAGANKEVLQSILTSLSALNSEGNGFKNLNNIIKQLSKADESKVLVENLTKLQNVLNKDVKDNSLINTIKEISKQGENLKDLATVLKASKEQIEKAQKVVGNNSKPSDGFIKDKKIVSGDLSKLTKRIGKLNNTELSNELKQISSDFNNIGNNSDKLKAVANSIAELTNKTQSAENEAKNLANNASMLTKNYQELASLYKQLKKAPVDSEESIEIQNRISMLETQNEALEKYTYTQEQSQNISKAKATADIAEKAAIDAKTKATEDAAKADQKAAEAEENAKQRVESLRISLLSQVSALKNNGKLMNAYGDEINTMISELSNTGIAEDKLSSLRDRVREIKAEANQVGKSGKSFRQVLTGRFQSLLAYLGTFASFYRVAGYIRTAFETIKDLDTQLVDLRKTTSMTTNELNQFYSASSNVAKELGVTTSEIISQAAAWSRLGYSTKEASTEMAKLSSKFASVSPGMTTENATDYLVSTMQAYGIAVDDVERKVMDNVNRIGNTFATTNAEIGEMLTRSSAAMNAANNSLEETIALESAAVEVTRNAEMTGTAFRTVSMRIRGLDEETEEALEDYEELKGKIADLTKTKDTPGGVSLFTDATKTEYKSTYQFLKDIAAVYDQISDKNQAALLEAIGGKRGAQSLAPILSNFKEVERAMKEMEGAAGSADKEMDIIRDKHNCLYVQRCA